MIEESKVVKKTKSKKRRIMKKQYIAITFVFGVLASVSNSYGMDYFRNLWAYLTGTKTEEQVEQERREQFQLAQSIQERAELRAKDYNTETLYKELNAVITKIFTGTKDYSVIIINKLQQDKRLLSRLQTLVDGASGKTLR